MAALTETPAWDPIYQLETTDPVQGGPSGISNFQAQALANRTAMLYPGLLNGIFGNRFEAFEIEPNIVLPTNIAGKLLLLTDSPSGPHSGLGKVYLPAAADLEADGLDGAIVGLVSLNHSQEIVLEISGGGNFVALNKPWENEVYVGYGVVLLQCAEALTGTWIILSLMASENTMRSGALQLFGIGSGPHPGWLPCDGSTVAKADYPRLWDAIGTAYGPATPTDFTLPEVGLNLDAVTGGTWYIKI